MDSRSGITAAISRYSISDMKTVLDEVRKKALENAPKNAQDNDLIYTFFNKAYAED